MSTDDDVSRDASNSNQSQPPQASAASSPGTTTPVTTVAADPPRVGTFDRRGSDRESGGVARRLLFDGDGPPTDGTIPPEALVPRRVIAWLMVVFGTTMVLAIDILIGVFPPDAPNANGAAATFTILWGALSLSLADAQRLMLLSMVMGVIGSLIHVMTSFADFTGNRRLASNWLPWYLLRPLIGAGLALFFYVVFRAGLLSAGTNGGAVNPYGVAALSGLAGLFSKQATDKLNETFTTLFKTNANSGDALRRDNLGKNAATRPPSTQTEDSRR